MEQQVVSIWAGTNGHLDDVPVADIRRFEREFLDHVGRSRPAVFDAIVQTGKLSDDTIGELEAGIAEFKQGFQTGEGKSLVNEAPAEAMEAEDRGQEKITRYAQPSSKKR
jgi:F-type H+-transporting ATPase subunit alpha